MNRFKTEFITKCIRHPLPISCQNIQPIFTREYASRLCLVGSCIKLNDDDLLLKLSKKLLSVISFVLISW